MIEIRKELTNLEKAFLLGHLHDYKPEISQFIRIHKAEWEKNPDIMDYCEEYHVTWEPFVGRPSLESLKKEFQTSLRRVRNAKVGTDVITFLMELNNEARLLQMSVRDLESKESYRHYLIILLRILQIKVEAIELARRISSTEDVIPHVSNLNYMTEFLGKIYLALNTNYEMPAREAARNLYLFYYLQVRSSEHIRLEKACEFILLLLEMCRGTSFVKCVKQYLDEFSSDHYLPLMCESAEIESSLTKIEGTMAENYSNKLTNESRRRFLMFGETADNIPITHYEGAEVLDALNPRTIRAFTNFKPSFEIPENDLYFVAIEHPETSLAKIKSKKQTRFILTRLGDPTRYLLFKSTAMGDNALYGISLSYGNYMESVHSKKMIKIPIIHNRKYMITGISK